MQMRGELGDLALELLEGQTRFEMMPGALAVDGVRTIVHAASILQSRSPLGSNNEAKHRETQVFDGVYVTSAEGRLRFVRVPAPTPLAQSVLLEEIARRVARYLERRAATWRALRGRANGCHAPARATSASR